MDSTSKIHGNTSADDAVILALDNLSLTEVFSNQSQCPQKDSATEATLNIQPDIYCNETSKTIPLVIMQNDAKTITPTQDCALTILDDHCNLPNNESSLNSTYVVPEDMVNSLRDSINDKMKMDFVIGQNNISNSHQQNPRSNSLDCVVTLFDSSESDCSSYDSDASYDSERAAYLEYFNEREFSPVKSTKSLHSDGESTEEFGTDSEEDSSDSHHKDSSYSGEDSNDSNKDSSDLEHVSSNGDSDEEPSDDEAVEDSDDDSATTSEEDKPDSDEERDPCNDNGSSPIESSESEESSDDDKSVDLDESAESSSESSEDSD